MFSTESTGQRGSRIYGEDFRVLCPLQIKLDTFKGESGQEWRLNQPLVELDVVLPQQQQQQQNSITNCDSSSIVSTVAVATPTFGRPYVSYKLC
nr:hypothetical protein [Apis mellifera nudivirus]